MSAYPHWQDYADYLTYLPKIRIMRKSLPNIRDYLYNYDPVPKPRKQEMVFNLTRYTYARREEIFLQCKNTFGQPGRNQKYCRWSGEYVNLTYITVYQHKDIAWFNLMMS